MKTWRILTSVLITMVLAMAAVGFHLLAAYFDSLRKRYTITHDDWVDHVRPAGAFFADCSYAFSCLSVLFGIAASLAGIYIAMRAGLGLLLICGVLICGVVVLLAASAIRAAIVVVKDLRRGSGPP